MLQVQLNGEATVRRVLTWTDREDAISQRTDWARRLPIFFGLTPAECRAIVAAACETKFSRSHTVFIEGDPCRQVLLVLSGCVKVTQLGASGCEVILWVCGSGELVGALESSSGSNNLVTARTAEPTTALEWDAPSFETICDCYPIIRRNTARLLGLRLQELEDRFREISTQKVVPRLSQQLIRLSNQLRQHTNGRPEINLSREELAQLTGTTQFTVSRLLCQWGRLGIVSSRRHGVVVLKVQALKELSEAG